MNHLYKLQIVSFAAAAGFGAPASAAVTVYTDGPSFSAATTGDTSYSIPSSLLLTSPLNLNGVIFSSAGLDYYNDGAYASGSYLAARFGDSLSISTSSSAFAIYLGSYFDAQTITYSVDGVTGTFDVPGNHIYSVFIGFTGLAGNSTLTFSNNHELDLTYFVTGTTPGTESSAVPEPDAWVLMLVGFAGVGMAIRNRRRSVIPQIA